VQRFDARPAPEIGVRRNFRHIPPSVGGRPYRDGLGPSSGRTTGEVVPEAMRPRRCVAVDPTICVARHLVEMLAHRVRLRGRRSEFDGTAAQNCPRRDTKPMSRMMLPLARLLGLSVRPIRCLVDHHTHELGRPAGEVPLVPRRELPEAASDDGSGLGRSQPCPPPSTVPDGHSANGRWTTCRSAG
jgi:hypothetical protein